MKEVRQVAAEYAVAQTNEVMSLAIAKAYADGYRDGYKERDEEIAIDFRDNKTEYVDLGLPSGTLWAADYEQKNGEILYLPYEDASNFQLPTKEQWKELLELCKWEFATVNNRDLNKCHCIGPNGNIITFLAKGYVTVNSPRYTDEIFFWLYDSNDEITDKDVAYVQAQYYYYGNVKNITGLKKNSGKLFSGYSLPVRLVGK